MALPQILWPARRARQRCKSKYIPPHPRRVLIREHNGIVSFISCSGMNSQYAMLLCPSGGPEDLGERQPLPLNPLDSLTPIVARVATLDPGLGRDGVLLQL